MRLKTVEVITLTEERKRDKWYYPSPLNFEDNPGLKCNWCCGTQCIIHIRISWIVAQYVIITLARIRSCWNARRVLYACFWVISRFLNFIRRRFGTICLFHLHRHVGVCVFRHTPTCPWIWNRQNVPKRRHIKFRRRGITHKKPYNI